MRRNKKKATLQGAFLLFLIIGTVIVIRQQNATPYQHNEGMVFGTVYSMTYQSTDDLRQEIEAELQKVDSSLSTFNEQSITAKINRGMLPEVDDMFMEVFELAQQVAKDTDGAFDFTIAPLVNAWGFGFKKGSFPDKHTVDSLMELVDYRMVELVRERGATVVNKRKPNMMLDFSAIAKGYGCDAVARMFRQKGIKNFMVEIGGEVVTSGMSAKRLPWRIGITKPEEDSLGAGREMQTIVNVTDMAMATSGNYRNFYYKNGKRYAHTINPKTGYPVQHNILSATVLAKNCATADAYATAFMVMGLEKARDVLDRNPGLMAYMICAGEKGENTVWYSPSMRNKIKEVSKE